ncbi:MAG: (2Fe-2S)-binding protein [Bacteroidales bacterium]|nr:(2Fe-2S)-binding protein [Bacteroidales bacterium]
MSPDEPICLCFRVSRRKLESFVRLHQPQVPSQLSQCGGAGTGCGWCVPFLKQIHRKGTHAAEELESLTAEEYACRRRAYLRQEPSPSVSEVAE